MLSDVFIWKCCACCKRGWCLRKRWKERLLGKNITHGSRKWPTCRYLQIQLKNASESVHCPILVETCKLFFLIPEEQKSTTNNNWIAIKSFQRIVALKSTALYIDISLYIIIIIMLLSFIVLFFPHPWAHWSCWLHHWWRWRKSLWTVG